MADETLRWIYSAADETVAQLDQHHRALHERALTTRQSLDTLVGRLGESSVPYVESMAEGAAGGPATETSRGRPQPVAAKEPYFPLPERSTHGGPFGPKVRALLLAEALAKDTTWR